MRNVGHAMPRVGLLGNPSDGYGGRVVSFTFADFAARVVVEDDPGLALGGSAGWIRFDDAAHAIRRAPAREMGGGAALLFAALRRFVDHTGIAPADPRCSVHMAYDTDIPRQVGLAGSSAIIIAAMLALAARFDYAIDPYSLAMLALAAETQELGIAAGPQDRVIQAYGGLLYMDFRELDQRGVRVLDPALLPPLFVAWDPRPGRDSGATHAGVRDRWLRGDPDVRQAMVEFAELADAGLACLLTGDRSGLATCMNRNFDRRAGLFQLAARERELVDLGRSTGAAVKFAGSGGAVVGTIDDDEHYHRIVAVYRDHGYRVLRPRLSRGAGA